MDGITWPSRILRVGVLFLAAIALALAQAGCAPLPAGVAPPQAPGSSSGKVVEAAAAELALARTDMPAGFQLAAERESEREYVALYLRPSALETEASGGNTLLSVMTSIGVYTTTVDAVQIYAQAIGDATAQEPESSPLIGQNATDVVTAPFAGAVQGADASEAFRVTYRLLDRTIVEYGHRFRLGNVLAHVVVAAIGDPNEPASLLGDARDLVQRQIDQIVAAASD